MFNFEKFNAVGCSFVSKVSLRINGSIGLSQGALRKFKLDTGEWWAVLYYDKDSRVIGIRPTQNENEESAIKLQRREVGKDGARKNFVAQISARAFLDYFAIPYEDQTRSYVPSWDSDNKMIVVDLKNEKIPVRRNKADSPGVPEAKA